MKKQNIIVFALLGLIVFFHSTTKIKAVDLITNGSFESATAFQGWTITNAGSSWMNWANTTAGNGGGFSIPTATTVIHGSKNVWNGITAGANQSHTMFQQITIPAGQSASVHWSDKYQMNYTEFCSTGCGTAQYFVEITNTAGTVLQTLYTVTTLTNTNTNTGWVTHVLDLGTAYAGQTIRIRFRTFVTTSLQGPGQVEIDNVQFLSPSMVPTAANVSVGGRVFDSGTSGMSKVAVTLTNASGNSQTVYTNSFGHYKFDEVPVGQTYILTVNHRKYLFPDSPRVVAVEDNLTNVDFQASP
jgi:hypothetical protein